MRMRISAVRPLAAPRLSLELRDESGLLVAGSGQSVAELAGTTRRTELSVRFDVERLPLADGRFHLRLG